MTIYDNVNGNHVNGKQRSIADLVKDLASGTQSLLGQEIQLAKLEMKESVTKAGMGAGLLAGAAVFGLVGLIMLAVTVAIALIQLGVTPWLSGLIVTVAFFGLAGILALVGKRELSKANPKPEETIETLKENREWLRQQVR